ANSRSKAATSGPCVTHPERMARRAASASSSSIQGRATGIMGRSGQAHGRSLRSLRVPVADHLGLEKLFRRLVLRSIPVEQALEAVLEGYPGAESENPPRHGDVRAESQNVSGPRRIVRHAERTLGHRGNGDRKVVDADFAAAAEIQRASHGLVRRGGEDDAPGGVLDEHEVARLLAVAEDDHGPVGEAAQQKFGYDLAAVAFVMAARSVGIEWPDHDR